MMRQPEPAPSTGSAGFAKSRGWFIEGHRSSTTSSFCDEDVSGSIWRAFGKTRRLMMADPAVIEVPSPDGRHRARLRYAGEIRFGPPYFHLELDERKWRRRLFGDAHLWSPEGNLFVVQEWLSTDYGRGPVTRLLIVDADERREITIAETDRGFVVPVRFIGERLVVEQQFASVTRQYDRALPERRGWSRLAAFWRA
jgi:hypothetical protein